PLRERVVDATIDLLSHKNVKVGVKAAAYLSKALRYPMGNLNVRVPQDVRDGWTEEFVGTLGKIEQAVLARKLDPLVLIEVVRSVSWHKQYAGGQTAECAKRLVAAMPKSLEFRTTLALIDGW